MIIIPKIYRIPPQYARRNFPLLFPKGVVDEFAIRGIADSWDIGYDGLGNELEWLQRHHESKETFRPRNRKFRKDYRNLVEAVRAEGQKYNIELSKYNITLPKSKT